MTDSYIRYILYILSMSNENLTETICSTFTERERKMLELIAEYTGMTVSQVVRKFIREKLLTVKLKEIK